MDPSKLMKSGKEFIVYEPKKYEHKEIPDNPGNYIFCLLKDSNLPDTGLSFTMNKFNGLNVIYTGIAINNLRIRTYRKHINGKNSGNSSIRKSIGSMFGFEKIPKNSDASNGKTKFNKIDEAKLSKWMVENLLLYYTSNLYPEPLEKELILDLNPPLNLQNNENETNLEFRKKLKELRG